MRFPTLGQYLKFSLYRILVYSRFGFTVQVLKYPLVRDQRFVGSDLTFFNPVKTNGPVETVQLRT
jgi:hypothetical protein